MARNDNRIPTAEMLSTTPGVCTKWMITWPSRPNVWPKSYRVTTYPDTTHIFVETAAKKRVVGLRTKTRLEPAIRAALAAATPAP